MIKNLFSYTIAGLAFISLLFFSYYKGELISYTTLWLILSIMVFPIAFYITYTGRTQNEIDTSAVYSSHHDKLITIGEQIKLDIDSCEIRENNYYEGIPRHNLRGTDLIVAAFDANENRQEKYIDQSAIIYHHKIGDKVERYVSQTFPFGSETLTLHILNNDIVLYVDRCDRNNYSFDFIQKRT